MPRINHNTQSQISFVLDKKDYEAIKQKADKLRLSIASYLTMVGVNSEVKIDTREPEK